MFSDKPLDKKGDTLEDESVLRIEKRKALFAQANALPKYELPEDYPDAAEMIRQMRDERTDRIYNPRCDK